MADIVVRNHEVVASIFDPDEIVRQSSQPLGARFDGLMNSRCTEKRGIKMDAIQ
jgi:hypothetical protein